MVLLRLRLIKKRRKILVTKCQYNRTQSQNPSTFSKGEILVEKDN